MEMFSITWLIKVLIIDDKKVNDIFHKNWYNGFTFHFFFYKLSINRSTSSQISDLITYKRNINKLFRCQTTRNDSDSSLFFCLCYQYVISAIMFIRLEKLYKSSETLGSRNNSLWCPIDHKPISLIQMTPADLRQLIVININGILKI